MGRLLLYVGMGMVLCLGGCMETLPNHLTSSTSNAIEVPIEDEYLTVKNIAHRKAETIGYIKRTDVSRELGCHPNPFDIGYDGSVELWCRIHYEGHIGHVHIADMVNINAQ